MALVLDTLQQAPEDAEVTYAAALVLAQAGDSASALACTRRALEMGVQTRWFSIPSFTPLHDDARFQQLLVNAGTE